MILVARLKMKVYLKRLPKIEAHKVHSHTQSTNASAVVFFFFFFNPKIYYLLWGGAPMSDSAYGIYMCSLLCGAYALING